MIEKYFFILCSYIINLILNFFIISFVLSIFSIMILFLILFKIIFIILLMNIFVEIIIIYRFRVLKSLKIDFNAASIFFILNNLFINLIEIFLLVNFKLTNLFIFEYITLIKSSENFMCVLFVQFFTNIDE